MKKKPIYLYILLFFSTVGTLTSAVSTFGASKSFELTDDFAKQLGLTTAQDKADYVTYYEKSAQLNQSTNLFICFPDSDCLTGNFLFPLYEAGSVNSPLYLHGADFIKSILLLL